MSAEARKATPDDIAAISMTLSKAVHDDPIKTFLAGGRTLRPM